MYSTINPCSSTTSLISLLASSPQNPLSTPSLFVPNHHRRRGNRRTISLKSSHSKPQAHLRIRSNAGPIRLLHPSRSSTLLSTITKERKSEKPFVYFDENVLSCIAKPIVFTLFWIFLGLSPIRGFQLPATAATAVSVEPIERTKGKGKDEDWSRKGQDYSGYTGRLLETVSGLLRSVEEVKSGDGDVKSVEVALKVVKSKKKELQEEIMGGLYADLRVLKGEKDAMLKRADEILDSLSKTKREQESLLRKSGGEEGVKEQVEKLEAAMRSGEEEYNGIWERIGDIEDQILRRETMALSIGVREISFIERECELLVEGFSREMRRKNMDR